MWDATEDEKRELFEQGRRAGLPDEVAEQAVRNTLASKPPDMPMAERRHKGSIEMGRRWLRGQKGP